MRKQKTWYCPHYSRLPQFKRRGGTRTSAQPSMASIQAAMKLDNICICKAKPSTTETVVECHGDNCKNGKFFHFTCHSLNRMPDNYWKCSGCNKLATIYSATTLTKYCSSSDSSSGEGESDISISKVSKEVCLIKWYNSRTEVNKSCTNSCHVIHQWSVVIRVS